MPRLRTDRPNGLSRTRLMLIDNRAVRDEIDIEEHALQRGDRLDMTGEDADPMLRQQDSQHRARHDQHKILDDEQADDPRSCSPS